MERLVKEGQIDSVLDITTTEICDHLIGGSMSAVPECLEAAAKVGIPYVVSLGATDMVNFRPVATVPEKYQLRKLFEHNSDITLMQTSEEECEQIGKFLAEKLRNFAVKPKMVQVVLTSGGVSMIAEQGGPFEDVKADDKLFQSSKRGSRGVPSCAREILEQSTTKILHLTLNSRLNPIGPVIPVSFLQCTNPRRS